MNTVSLYALSTQGGILQPRGLAWAPDSSQVFGVLSRSSSFVLAVVPNPTTPQPDPTSSTVNCQPNEVVIGQATSCTAAVTDTAPGATAPTGQVTFASDTAGGSFSASSCTLAPDSTIGQASCAVTYTPGETGSGSQTVTGRGFFSAAQCTLSGTGTSASCAVSFQPAATFMDNGETITASYGGDSTHQASAGSVKLQ